MKKRRVEIKFKFPKWFEAVTARYDELLEEVAATVLTNRAQLFDAGGAHNGHEAWEPPKMREGIPLSDKGVLRRSVSSTGGSKPGPGGIIKFESDVVKLSTNIAYAAIQNYGGIVRPKNKKALAWKVGKQWHFAQKVEIPKRPFLDGAWNQQDQDEVNQVLKAKIEKILSGAPA